MERRYILEVLEGCAWNITQAAKILGIHRVTLHKKIDHAGLRSQKK